ncbi:DUF3099 domain-containing protein [Nocardia flavorosea]|uniref:DUF3099 domain-containing protein n=1 Tax=Nocardia flavorosea TaxID=53429 RepID=A0A846YL71_9NOCA|nr:DUF3099 domain-containing protein [Nocardia flavorosea]NKY59735.1 DUF3099 domain-containing protein [Nocardia flavorosea]
MQQHGEDSGRGSEHIDAGASGLGEDIGAPRPARPTRSSGYFPGDDAKHAALITEAAPSFQDQHRARVRRYTIIMAFRIPALILAGISYSVFGNALIAILIMAASVPLPWVAVLIANDRPPRDKNEPSRWDPPRTALEERRHDAIDG